MLEELDAIYYKDDDFTLLFGDCVSIMKKIQDNTFDMIFANPPYFLSKNGITCSGGKMVSVNKAEWDMDKDVEQMHEFNYAWLSECKRILKPNGTIWISGTFHNIYSIGLALQQLDYKLLNNITWYKRMLHQTFLADISLIQQKQYCGQRKVRNPNTTMTIS